jgi:hypothetical protein
MNVICFLLTWIGTDEGELFAVFLDWIDKGELFAVFLDWIDEGELFAVFLDWD